MLSADPSGIRTQLRAEHTLRGTAWCRAQSDRVDSWLSGLLAMATHGPVARGAGEVALVAVGGYGRRELCPGSDLDVVLLHERRADPTAIAGIAERLWYPVWDEGFKLGHNVSTVRQALTLASGTVESATSLLSARPVAGSARLSQQLAQEARDAWRHRADHWLAVLAASTEQRHRQVGEAAFALEPDLKEAHGGLRDVHTLGWVEATGSLLLDIDPLCAEYGVLLDARVELQRSTGRGGNVLTLQDQDPVAASLGFGDADQLMAEIAAAARRIAWVSDDAWRRVASSRRGPAPRGSQRPRLVLPGVVVVDGEVAATTDAEVGDPLLTLRVARAAASAALPIERRTLARLGAAAPALPEPWPPGARDLFVDLLATGRDAIAVVEALDHARAWAGLLPEWPAVRSLPQRNAFHVFTVDRHLLETVAQAAPLAARVERPDLLLLASLLHDVGKGHAGDHSVVGRDLAAALAQRMGLAAPDVDTVAALVGQHLLLATVATRRDLDDPRTIDQVAAAVGERGRLQLLAALTEADSRATGPTAWTAWKAALVARLVERTDQVLSDEATTAGTSTTGTQPHPSATTAGPQSGQPITSSPGVGNDHPTTTAGLHTGLPFASPGVVTGQPTTTAGLHTGLPFASPGVVTGQPTTVPGGRPAHGAERHRVDADGQVLRVVTEDRAKVFDRLAGVLALHGFDVVAATITSGGGRVEAEFRVTPSKHRLLSEAVGDVHRALEGRLALSARLTDRIRAYGPPRVQSRHPIDTVVRVDNSASDTATVIDVHTADRMGVLYRITQALGELDLEIRSARVETLGPEVVDSFYVQDRTGVKVDDLAASEVERAVRHALDG